MTNILDDKVLEYINGSLQKKEHKPISDSQKVLMATGMGIVPIITEAILRRKIDLNVIPKSIVMGAIGYAIPTMINVAMSHNDNERPSYLKSEFNKITTNPFSKTAALPAIGGLVSGGIRYALQGGKDLLS